MRTVINIAVVLALVVAAGCAAPPPAEPETMVDLAAEELAIRDLSAAWLEAARSRDAATLDGLRPTFLHHRELLGGLARTAWETVIELMCAAAGDEELRPGMVAVVQTAGDLANWHSHAHALVCRGGWSYAGGGGTTSPFG